MNILGLIASIIATVLVMLAMYKTVSGLLGLVLLALCAASVGGNLVAVIFHYKGKENEFF